MGHKNWGYEARLSNEVCYYHSFSCVQQCLTDTESRFGHFLHHSIEPAVWVNSFSGLISVAIYLNMTCNQAHQIFAYYWLSLCLGYSLYVQIKDIVCLWEEKNEHKSWTDAKGCW